MPTYENHIKFIKSNPYRYWYLIYLNSTEIGTFYIQNNNSIGINIEQPKEIIIKKIITYVQKKIKPKKSIPSKVPEYYFINVPEKNKKLKKILEKLGCISIQKSFRIKS